jgi:Skp family chaperone for outer membrane proteins
MKKIILSSLVVLGLSTAAFAQAAAPDFATVDADASGGVSLAEAQVAWPDLTEEAFTAADIDANGELSAEELATLAAPVAPAS